ncbi:helix-turn-helix domain-containing protein [Sphingomonas sp. Sphisp140]|uniref:helix-turn-helix domain-containing protein n=1 Tax=unclassified Sphingomonas TaxID=196159 RepID=UPI0039AF84AA
MKPPRGIKTDHYTTAGFPAADRHDLWSARGWPSIASVFDSTPIGPFHTTAENVLLDGVPVSYSHGTARRFERTPERIAADGIDALGISVLLEGRTHGSAAGLPFVAEAGEVVLLDLTQVSSVVISENRSIQFAVPRDRAELEIGPVEPLHGRVIGRAAAALLHGHLVQLAEGMKYIPETDAARVARTLIDMLALAIRAEGEAALGESAVQSLALRVRGEIHRNLGSPGLNAASLCRRFAISRSTLHRLFEEEGGIQSYIRATRLDAARTALLTPPRADRIGDIAERLGFSDAAHLSRLFRQRFGESPSDCRKRARDRGEGQ